MRRWISRHTRLSQFLANRFEASHSFGLTATLLCAAFLFILLLWAGTVFGFLMLDVVRQTDTRLANLIHANWAMPLLRFFTHVTVIGGARVIVVLLVGFLIALWLCKRVDLMLGMTIATVGDKLMVGFLKDLFDRPRPEFSYFVETSGSFPSGHAAISVAFYGMVFYCLWRLRLLGPLMALMLAVIMAFAIGLSRIYLIEHYLSDVWHGFLIGGLWLVIGIGVSEWWREKHPTLQAAENPQLMPMIVVVLALAAAGWLGYSHTMLRNFAVPGPSSEIAMMVIL
jgi:undecaprenyl-diphosphatase